MIQDAPEAVERHELCHCPEPCTETFECFGCKREVPYCFGAADDMPDHCDDCWVAPEED